MAKSMRKPKSRKKVVSGNKTARKASKKKVATKVRARKKKSAAKKSPAKKSPAKKSPVKKSPVKRGATLGLQGFAVSNLGPDPKNTAVVSCVNAQMDADRPGWNDNGTMDNDYQYNIHSIRAFLSSVAACLQGQGYHLDFNNGAFVQACLTSAVYRLKQRVYDRTT